MSERHTLLRLKNYINFPVIDFFDDGEGGSTDNLLASVENNLTVVKIRQTDNICADLITLVHVRSVSHYFLADQWAFPAKLILMFHYWQICGKGPFFI